MRFRELTEAQYRLPKGTYFHASPTELSVGTVLRPRGENEQVFDSEISDILERNRPAGVPPRHDMIFMCDTQEALGHLALDHSHLYAIRPTASPLIRADHAWVNAIFHVVAENDDTGNDLPEAEIEKCNDWAKRYWAGEIAWSKLGRSPLYLPMIEIMAPQAVVTKVFY